MEKVAKEPHLTGSHTKLTCSVVVCTRDRPEALDECLAAISAGTRSATEVIVIDSAPMHTSAEQVAARWGARYLREPLPGISRARNRAARESDSDILAFIDDDTIPEPGWLEPLMAEFVDPMVVVAAGRILPPEGKMDLLPVYAWWGMIDLGPQRRVFDRSTPDWYELTNFGGVGIGANIALRRAVFRNWKGFDQRLGVGTLIEGGEELKAFFELVDLGYRLVYAPRSVVRHTFPRSQEQICQRALRLIEASAAYLVLSLCERPAYRKETWGYIKRKLKRVKQIYSFSSVKQALIPGHLVLAARLKGVCLYFAACLLDKVRQV